VGYVSAWYECMTITRGIMDLVLALVPKRWGTVSPFWCLGLMDSGEAHGENCRSKKNMGRTVGYAPCVDILICIGSLPILETWPLIYRGHERMVGDRLKASQVYSYVYFRYTPCLTDLTFEFIRSPTTPILSPSSRTFVELTLVNWRRPWGL
jgi:hypothetical protein